MVKKYSLYIEDLYAKLWNATVLNFLWDGETMKDLTILKLLQIYFALLL